MYVCRCEFSLPVDSGLLKMLPCLVLTARWLHEESTLNVLKGKTYLLKIDLLIINLPPFWNNIKEDFGAVFIHFHQSLAPLYLS